MDQKTHRTAGDGQRETATREIAWTIRSVLLALAPVGIRQPELVPVKVERDSRYR